MQALDSGFRRNDEIPADPCISSFPPPPCPPDSAVRRFPFEVTRASPYSPPIEPPLRPPERNGEPMNTAAAFAQLGTHVWLVLPVLSLTITAAVIALLEDF
jgi:hypothetical protein